MRLLTLAWVLVALTTLSTSNLFAADVALPSDVTITTQSSVRATYARDSAAQPGAGQWSVGIFNPLEVGVTEDLSLLTHPLLLLASPNVTARYHVTDWAGFRVVAEAGLALPRLAMVAPLPLGLAGWFFPACKVARHDQKGDGTCDRPGWILVPHVGAIASYGTDHVTSIRVEFAAGLPLSGELARPLEHIAPADLIFAPATYGWRSRIGVRHDHLVLPRIRLSAEANLYVVGASEEPRRSPWTLSGHVGVDIQLSTGLRLTGGVLLTNSDQRAQELVYNEGYATRKSVRSTDFWPTLDLIWTP